MILLLCKMEYHWSYKNGYDDFHSNTQDYFESTIFLLRKIPLPYPH